MNAIALAMLDVEDTLALERLNAVMEERECTVSMLVTRGLAKAAQATRASRNFHDFMKMRGAMLAGGLHCVRLRGGRGIER